MLSAKASHGVVGEEVGLLLPDAMRALKNLGARLAVMSVCNIQMLTKCLTRMFMEIGKFSLSVKQDCTSLLV